VAVPTKVTIDHERVAVEEGLRGGEEEEARVKGINMGMDKTGTTHKEGTTTTWINSSRAPRL